MSAVPLTLESGGFLPALCGEFHLLCGNESVIDGDGGVRQGCERAPTAGGWSHPSVATHGEGAAHQHGTADRGSGTGASLMPRGSQGSHQGCGGFSVGGNGLNGERGCLLTPHRAQEEHPFQSMESRPVKDCCFH